MSDFFDGFEKAAASLIGAAKGLRSGLPATRAPGVIRTAMPSPAGVSVAPRSTPPPLPTPGASHAAAKAQLPVTKVRMPVVPKPTPGTTAGNSTMAI